MRERPEPEAIKPLTARQRKRLREMLVSILESHGNQRDYLVSMLLSEAAPESGDEPSLRSLRAISSNVLEQLILILRGLKNGQPSMFLYFFEALKHLPLDASPRFKSVLQDVFGSEPAPTEMQVELFRQLELLYLLAKMEDFEAARQLAGSLEPRVSISHPQLHVMYQVSQARILQHRGKRLRFTSLWLGLVSDLYQLDGPEGALYVVLRWITVLHWGRESSAKKALLLKFGPGSRHGGNLLSANLLYALFTLENKLISPDEKMQYARLLFRHPTALLTVQQMQLLHFFAGNYYSGMKLSMQKSIRYYQHSNYFMHKSWAYLQGLSQFLRENQGSGQFVSTMPHLERWVIELGSQMSLQNNAYVETLHANYETIRELYHQVEELSITDNLTGLRNRRFLANNLYHMFQLASRHKVPVCFAMLDIDLFKRVNDEHGHIAGDKVLKELAQLLTGSFRKSDVIVRYGGEEFLLIFFDTRREHFMHLMEELRHRVQAHKFTFKGKTIRITVSIGVSCEVVPCLTEKQLSACIEKTDAALYIAKNTGRNMVVGHES
ncbi:MAG: GGDEF domain-containing protein [Candidatus Syntrophosphaera sp.]|nr:GGDEF domain-containing protein [Candidatus Syntrophosphaera sp.]